MKSVKRKGLQSLFLAFVLFVILTFASSTPLASAGDYGGGCPLNGTYNGTVQGGIYLKTVGSYGTSLDGTFYDVPDGRKITMLYFGIWEGSRGKAYNFTITINGNQSKTYHINDSEELDPWCDAIDEPECHVSITGCGVNFVSYNATPLVVTGTNDVSITLLMESGDAVYAYQTTLFVVYENENMPEIQYWVKEGHEYPDIGVDFSMYFNETVNTGRIYTGSVESLKYWTIGFPHCFADEEPSCGWPTLNGNGIDEYDYIYSYGVTGSPSESKPPKCYATISRWDGISPDYITAPNNLFYYCGPGNLRLMVPILMLNYSESSDLNVTDISPESICVDYYNSIDAKIVNTGGTARFFNATLYVDGGLVDVKRVTNLGEGESRIVKFLWNPPVTTSCVLNVTVDVENVVRETDATNNSKTLSVMVTEAQPPEWSNQSSSIPEIPEGGTIELRAQGRADIGLDRAILATNETGTWINHTDYGSPMDMASLYNHSFTHTSKADWKAQTLDNVTATENGEDVKLYQSLGTTNLAYLKTAYAKDSFYPASDAVDGKLGTSWESDSMIPPNGAEPNWWYVDLGEVTAIKKIDIHISTDYGPFLYDIYISNDGTEWTKKKEASGATSKTFTNLDWSCRYINITYLEDQGDYGWAALTEFEAYGPGDYASSGTLTSSTIETDNPIVAVTPEWNSNEPAGTSISVNVSVDNGATWKSAVNGEELTWDYDTLNNTKLKYKVLFKSTDVNETPVLHDDTLNYVTRDPVEGTWLWSKFTWQNASIPEGTTVGWKIYYGDMLGKTNCTNVETFVVGAPGPVIELIREQANTTGLNQETTVRLVVWNTDSSESDTSSLNLTEWIDPDWTVTDCGSCYENTSTYIKWTLGDLARDNYTMVSYRIKAPANSEISTFKANCTYKYNEQDGSAEGSEFTVAVESGKAFFDFELDMDASTSTIDRDIPECTEKTVNYTVTNVGDAAPCDTVFIELKINKTAWNVTCAYCDEFYNDTGYYYLKWIEDGSSWSVQQTKVFNFTVNSCQPGYYNFASNGTYDPPASAFTGQIYYKMAGMSFSASPDPEEDNADEPEEPSIILTASKKHFVAINTHKSIYLPDETAFIGMAVLDDEGHMVCDAEVTLTITDPGNKETVLSTGNGSIKVSQECSVYGVTNLPDYYAIYVVDGVGTYEMNLTAVTPAGAYSITDNFTVQNSVDFDVARDGPTRIYPPVPYVMNFTIKANKNYNGPIRGYVPASFAITPQDGLTVTTVGDAKRLTWNKNLAKGETRNIYYEFDAPDVSPYFYSLGRFQIGSFEEKRDWMIVSDADTTLRPNSDGTTGSFTSTAATFYTEIDDDPDAADDDTTYVQGPNIAYGSMFVLLEDTPADFTSADTVEIKAKHQEVGSDDDTIDIYYQIFESDETTAITEETTATRLTQGTYTIDAKTVSVTGTNDKTTWDGARLKIRQDYAQVKGPDTTSQARITAVEVTITYTPPADSTPPTYTNDGDNSSGSVTEGTIVETHVYWTDADSNLGKAVLRTNKTGEWTNESWYTFAGNAEWANITFDTSGYGGKTICWAQWANDTSNNWNTSMSTTAHCFNVLHVTKISQILINDTTPDQGDSVKIEAKLEYDNGTPIADQNVSFYYDTSIINSDFTNETGWATVLWDTTGVTNGTYKINATYSGNSSIYTGASYNNTQEVEITEKIFVTNIEVHFVRVTKTAGGVPNVVVTVHNTSFGNMLAGDNTTIYLSLTLNNSEGTGPAEIEAVFTTNVSEIYGLNGTGTQIIPGNYFELGQDTNEKALTNTTTKAFISTVAAGATVDYNAILMVPAGQAADDYSGIVELSW